MTIQKAFEIDHKGGHCEVVHWKSFFDPHGILIDFLRSTQNAGPYGSHKGHKKV